MMRIDSHQHFWKYDPVKDAWITEAMAVIKNDFMPEDVYPQMKANGIDGCIAVQADQSEAETHFLLELAAQYDYIRGVVGWVDFRATNITDRLEYFSQFKALKGFRHIVQAEPQDDFLLREDFCQGIALLSKYGFTYDILIYPKHLLHALTFVKRFPEQQFIIDHLAKPLIKAQHISRWLEDIRPFAKFENVSCKMAGLVTEGDLANWKMTDFKPYVNAVLDIFGTDRVIFGSDWPVCLVGASYAQTCEILEKNTAHLSSVEKEKLWGGNCARVYKC